MTLQRKTYAIIVININMKILIVIIMEIIMLVQEGAGLETLCSAVRELIHSCGDELGWCFTEDQVHYHHVSRRR